MKRDKTDISRKSCNITEELKEMLRNIQENDAIYKNAWIEEKKRGKKDVKGDTNKKSCNKSEKK